MKHATLGQVSEWAGGELVGGTPDDPIGPDVVIDSRAITPGSLFVAIPGERVDGHDFVAHAGHDGAAAALVQRRVDADVPQIVVGDTIEGLSCLARGVVADAKASGLVTVGITGSNGKTSTKDLLAQVLGVAGETVAPVGSFNNEIGAPLTAAKVTEDTRFLISEMGARGIGHIAWLTSIVPPTIGVVLNVGHAHIGEFGSQANIARAKGELVEAVDESGWAVLNADDPFVRGMAPRTRGRIATFSCGDPVEDAPDAALRVWATAIAPDELQRFGFVLHAEGAASGEAPVQLRVLGEHNVANALAAATVGLCAGMTVDAVASALSAATPRSRWRMELMQRADGAAILADCYNANPDSMAAAIEAVARLRRPGGRVVAVLGDMLELGEDAPGAHETAGRQAADAGIDELVAIGEYGPSLARGFASCGRPAGYFASKEEIVEHLVPTLTGADVVLIKASRGIGLEAVAEALANDEGAQK